MPIDPVGKILKMGKVRVSVGVGPMIEGTGGKDVGIGGKVNGMVLGGGRNEGKVSLLGSGVESGDKTSNVKPSVVNKVVG